MAEMQPWARALLITLLVLLGGCRHCGDWHYHGPMAGHRIAHCWLPDSPYGATGYNIAIDRLVP